MLNYRLRFEDDTNGTVLVTSPDFPLVTFGADREDAIRRALEAAVTILQSMMDAREPIPPAPADEKGGNPDGDAVLALPAQVLFKIALYLALRSRLMTRADLQRRLGWQRESVDRLFRLEHASKLEQMVAAAAALDKTVEIALVDLPGSGKIRPLEPA